MAGLPQGLQGYSASLVVAQGMCSAYSSNYSSDETGIQRKVSCIEQIIYNDPAQAKS